MRLLTHNLLCGPKGGYPLRIRVQTLEQLQSEYDEEYVKRLLSKVEWKGLLSAVSDLKSQGYLVDVNLPSEPPSFDCNDPAILRPMHHLLNEIKITNGELECPDTQTIFPVKDGIPRMVFDGETS
eukprot:NODE_10765_length_492_cov_81.585366_g10113_i0.p1 GENE.NODE_10765_length_492_cov_81.585366_g10113_i0~~NODE_10765_length_492_cov_81.585366_g10113_i0.p1  ORF type:complete len:125 (-),score=21.72 NODE_10765_length_492_cov_81.585366_g10113_i0:70-444(-)